jgi:hypothetical protein
MLRAPYHTQRPNLLLIASVAGHNGLTPSVSYLEPSIPQEISDVPVHTHMTFNRSAHQIIHCRTVMPLGTHTYLKFDHIIIIIIIVVLFVTSGL